MIKEPNFKTFDDYASFRNECTRRSLNVQCVMYKDNGTTDREFHAYHPETMESLGYYTTNKQWGMVFAPQEER